MPPVNLTDQFVRIFRLKNRFLITEKDPQVNYFREMRDPELVLKSHAGKNKKTSGIRVWTNFTLEKLSVKDSLILNEF